MFQDLREREKERENRASHFEKRKKCYRIFSIILYLYFLNYLFKNYLKLFEN